MRNVISRPECAFFPSMMMSHVMSHRRHMWYRHVQLITLWIYGNRLNRQLFKQTQYLTHWKHVIWQINPLLPRWPSAPIGIYVIILKAIKQGKNMANKAVSWQWLNTEISRTNWNLHEMTATQFCCNSVSCVTGDASPRYWLDGDGDVTFCLQLCNAEHSSWTTKLSF